MDLFESEKEWRTRVPLASIYLKCIMGDDEKDTTTWLHCTLCVPQGEISQHIFHKHCIVG